MTGGPLCNGTAGFALLLLTEFSQAVPLSNFK